MNTVIERVEHEGPCPGTLGMYCRLCDLSRTSLAHRQALAPRPTVGLGGIGGPGTHFMKMMQEIKVPTCGPCKELAAKMDLWGIDGCLARHDQITQEIKGREAQLGVMTRLAAGGRALFKLGRMSIAGLVDEAIARARRELATAVCVYMRSTGIGDNLAGLTTVAGLKRDDPARPVVYAVTCDPRWCQLFDGPDRVVSAPPPPAIRTMLDPYGDHQMELRSGGKRWEWYARRCGTTAALPRLRTLPAQDEAWASRYAGATVLCPFAYHASRRWPIEHWLDLERRLTARGRQIIVVGSLHCGQIAMFQGEKLRNTSPTRLAAILKIARIFVGNDSGMTHFAGLVGTPSVAICGIIRGEDVFGIYPSVRSINGHLPCTGCRQQYDVRHRHGCKTMDPCNNLVQLTVAEVESAVA